MTVLGFDTSTSSTAVGLMLADGRVPEARDDPRTGERPGHSTRLLPLAHNLLEREGLRWEAIERIAVGVGPGTFTGLRIGMATARGLAQSLGVELVGVSSLRALAHPLRNRQENVLAAIDARRGEAFVASYRRGEELSEARALPPERFGEALDPGQPGGWVAVGDGALRFRDALASLGVEVPDPNAPLHKLRAEAICELGAGGAPSVGPLLPAYGRPPDAEIALQEVGS